MRVSADRALYLKQRQHEQQDDTVELIGNENLQPPEIMEGDAGVVLKLDGTFRIFQTSVIDADNMTERQIEQGNQILGIAAALRVPELMATLIDAAKNPELFEKVVTLRRTS
jgi:hypothetical protein